jgi:hypothetical protein
VWAGCAPDNYHDVAFLSPVLPYLLKCFRLHRPHHGQKERGIPACLLWICVFMCYIYIYIYIYIYVCIYICAFIYISMMIHSYMCVCVCMCVYSILTSTVTTRQDMLTFAEDFTDLEVAARFPLREIYKSHENMKKGITPAFRPSFLSSFLFLPTTGLQWIPIRCVCA